MKSLTLHTRGFLRASLSISSHKSLIQGSPQIQDHTSCLVLSCLVFNRPRSEGWSLHGHAISICPLSTPLLHLIINEQMTHHSCLIFTSETTHRSMCRSI